MRRITLLFNAAIILFSIAVHTNAQTITTNQTGTNDGYYFSFWNAGGGTVTMTLGAAGNYSVAWTNCNNFTCGKGWSTGGRKIIKFSGSFNGGSNGYLAVYGWTRNPLIEYYVVENYGNWTPPGGTSIGTLKSDGGTYNIYKIARTNSPSIDGDNTNFTQYWSVRTSRRSSGIVALGNHFDAWARKGMNMGSTWNYLIMETEGYKSSGSSNITVSEGTSSDTVSAPPSAVLTSPVDDNSNVMVYPNPATNLINIEVSPISDKPIHAEIYNLDGTLVKKLNLIKGVNTIDVKDMQSGNYFIRMNIDHDAITRKIVK
jgi:endo-1,4-beta-xylanase